MDSTIKKLVSYILLALVVIFTVVSILGVWGFLDLSNILGKMLSSLLIIFVASAVVLFIFSVVMKSDNKP